MRFITWNKIVNIFKSVNTRKNNKLNEKTDKSLRDIMKSVDYNVFRYRDKPLSRPFEIIWKRGWKHIVRVLRDSQVVILPNKFKIFSFNIDQMLNKENGIYPEAIEWPDGEFGILNIPNPMGRSFWIKNIPSEVISDLKITQDKDWKYICWKSGYAAWIEENWKIVTIKDPKYKGISKKWSPSWKTIYRELRDWPLDDSFIKVLGSYIAATVIWPDWKTILQLDVDPSTYTWKKENLEIVDPNEAAIQWAAKDLDRISWNSNDLFDQPESILTPSDSITTPLVD